MNSENIDINKKKEEISQESPWDKYSRTFYLKDEFSKPPIVPSYRILIRLKEVKKTTANGFELPDSTVDRSEKVMMWGRVAALGEGCFKGSNFQTGAWVKLGDWVGVKGSAGDWIRIEGKPFRIINDDEILIAYPDEPEEIDFF